LLLFSVGTSPKVAASTDNGDPPSTPVSWNIDLVGEISGGATDVFLVGDLLYVGAGSKLTILDVAGSVPTSLAGPEAVGAVSLPNHVRGIDVAGNYAYVAAQTSGLLVVDVTDPAHPIVVATTPGILDAAVVGVVGDYAYVADRSSGMRVADVSDPLSPTLIASYEPDGSLCGLQLPVPRGGCDDANATGGTRTLRDQGERYTSCGHDGPRRCRQ